MPPSPKPHIKGIKPVIHGGAGFNISQANSSLACREMLDLSTCCNPYGPPKGLRSALHNTDIEHYPDPHCIKLTALLSKNKGVQPANIIIGSGSTELIRLAVSAYAGPGDTIVIPCPTYGEYELAGTIADSRIAKYVLDEKDGFKMDCDKFIAFARQHYPAIIFLCNPNNPTGQYIGLSEVKRILDSFPDTLVIMDEAYIAFTDGAWDSSSLLKKGNLFIVRSMTKDYAIAGLRLGYGMASETIIESLMKVCPPWNVNAMAQEAGIAALSCGEYIEQCGKRIGRCKTYLTGQLTKMGYRCVPSSTNFFMFKTGNAGYFKKQMLAKGILVRDCTSFGLPEYVRIGPHRLTQCRRFIQAVKDMQVVH